MNKKGFTLVELLLYMGLMGILLGVLTNIFLSVLDIQSESVAASSVEQDGRYILARMGYDVPRATAITSPALVGTATNAAVLVINGVNYIYSASPSGNLVLSNNNGTDALTSFGSQVSNLNFLRLGQVGQNDTLQITFTLTSTTKDQSGVQRRNFQTTLGQRCNGLSC